MAKNLSPSAWIQRYLEPMRDENILKVINQPGLTQIEAHPWTFLKMATLWSYAHYTYLPIIKKHFKHAIYVDLFSGPGLAYEKETRHHLIATAVLMAAMKSTMGGFSKCVYVEKEQESSAALKTRLEHLKEKNLLTCEEYTIFTDDCNQAIEKVLAEINHPETHLFLFIDPYTFNCNFKTLQALIDSKLPFDMFMNLQVVYLARAFGREKTGEFNEEQLRAFYPDERWRRCIGSQDLHECLKEKYIEGLLEFGGNKIKKVYPIKVSGEGYYYYLLFTTRKDSSKWLKGIERIKNMVETFDCRSLRHYLDGGTSLDVSPTTQAGLYRVWK